MALGLRSESSSTWWESTCWFWRKWVGLMEQGTVISQASALWFRSLWKKRACLSLEYRKRDTRTWIWTALLEETSFKATIPFLLICEWRWSKSAKRRTKSLSWRVAFCCMCVKPARSRQQRSKLMWSGQDYVAFVWDLTPVSSFVKFTFLISCNLLLSQPRPDKPSNSFEMSIFSLSIAL